MTSISFVDVRIGHSYACNILNLRQRFAERVTIVRIALHAVLNSGGGYHSLSPPTSA